MYDHFGYKIPGKTSVLRNKSSKPYLLYALLSAVHNVLYSEFVQWGLVSTTFEKIMMLESHSICVDGMGTLWPCTRRPSSLHMSCFRGRDLIFLIDQNINAVLMSDLLMTQTQSASSDPHYWHNEVLYRSREYSIMISFKQLRTVEVSVFVKVLVEKISLRIEKKNQDFLQGFDGSKVPEKRYFLLSKFHY